MSNNLHNTSTADLIDELGNLQAAIKELETREKELSGELKSRLSNKLEERGVRFSAVKSSVPSTKLDQKKAKEFILANVEESAQSEFFVTTSSDRLTIKVLPIWETAA